MKTDELSNMELLVRIGNWIHSKRDREILTDRLVHGLTYEQLAEKHDLSVSQIRRIVYKGQERVFLR